MKKLFVLMLVLGIASFASAGLTWTDGAGGDVDTITLTSQSDTAVVYLTSDTSAMGSFLAGPANNSVAGITAAAPQPDAGGQGSAFVYTTGIYDGQMWGQAADSVEPYTNAAGNWFAVTIHATSAGTGSVNFDSDILAQLGTSDTLVVNHIPEPMTITLLGLGGLLLRRKK